MSKAIAKTQKIMKKGSRVGGYVGRKNREILTNSGTMEFNPRRAKLTKKSKKPPIISSDALSS